MKQEDYVYGDATALKQSPQRHPACSWCGLRIGMHRILGDTPTCTECRDGGRHARVKAYNEKLRRAAGSK